MSINSAGGLDRRRGFVGRGGALEQAKRREIASLILSAPRLAQERLPHALVNLLARVMRLQRWVVLDRQGRFLNPARQHIKESVREGALA